MISEAWHTLSVEEAGDRLHCELARGLANAEAARRLVQHGLNSLPQAHGRSALAIFLSQFHSLIVALLVVAAVVAFALEENIEAITILVVIAINATIGFFTEWKAEAALAGLQKLTVPVAHVIREGVEHQIRAAEPCWAIQPKPP